MTEADDTISTGTARAAPGQIEGPVRNVLARLQFISESIDGKDAAGGEGLHVLIYDCLDDASEALEQWKVAFDGGAARAAQSGA